MKKEDMTFQRIVRALRVSRHADDIFVTECKTGPTQGVAGHSRIDAWAMRRSYTRPLMTAYEVKVSRSDFQSDTKWTEYLPYCNQFYWATPWKLIMPEEVSGDAGLIWITNTGNRCIVKKKASHRTVPLSLDPPFGLFVYLMYSRATFGPERDDVTSEDYWKAWLEKKVDLNELGFKVSSKLRTEVREKITEVQKENEKLRTENAALAHIRDFVVNDIGVRPEDLRDWYSYRSERLVKERLKELNTAVPADLLQKLIDVRSETHAAHYRLEQAVKKLTEAYEDKHPES